MDELKISGKFLTDIISKILKSVVKQKLNCQADIQLNEVHATYADGMARLHLSIDADVTQEELNKLLSKFGIG